MRKVIGKKHLCSCEKKNFKSEQGYDNRSLFDRYPEIEIVINNKVDEKYRHFLAQPEKENGSIMWYSKTYTEKPQILSNLEGDERIKYENIKNETLNHYKTVINSLYQESKTAEAECIEKAIKFINDDFVYCYDNKTVLGIWGMQLKENVPLHILVERPDPFTISFIAGELGIINENSELIKHKGEIVFESEVPKVEPKEGYEFTGWDIDPINYKVTGDKEITAKYRKLSPMQTINVNTQPELSENFNVRFNAGENGNIKGRSILSKQSGQIITENEIPTVKPKRGYEFTGWDKNPVGCNVTGNEEFTAQYCKKNKIHWWKRFWNWLKGLWAGCLTKGCLKWLLLLLLLLLLIFLLSKLLRNCSGLGGGTPNWNPIEANPNLPDDPNSGRGGIYNPGDPLNPTPTPPDYSDILPPHQGTLPPIDTTKIIRNPGEPVIIENRLNILMENEDKSIMDLARDFKEKFPDDKYEVVYYDDVVKRMQIEVPIEERIDLREKIPAMFAPEYDLFVFDEALFEAGFTPNDPDFRDPNKSLYFKSIKAHQAWTITKGNDSLAIAIVDNGFNINHPEISEKVVLPYNVWSRTKEVFPQTIDHGTHVAGTALGIMNNKKGLCGIAPLSRFIPVQVADKQGLMTTTSILDGILYAMYQGATVINVSLGMQITGPIPESAQRDLQNNRFKEEERLWNHVMKISNRLNATIVMAAGNDNILAGVDPTNRPNNFVIVTAVDKDNREFRKAGFSNYGEFSTISAPGVDIYSSVGNNNFTKMSGTSMAAPIISGAILLMKSLKRDLTNDQIICILQSTGLAADGKIGNVVQIDKALHKVLEGKFDDCVPETSEPLRPCDTITASGGDEGYAGSFDMGQKSGSFIFQYNTRIIPDRITIYDGENVGEKVIFKYEGGTKGWENATVNFNNQTITVEIIGLGEGTGWTFIVNCPNQAPKTPPTDSDDNIRQELEQEREQLRKEQERLKQEEERRRKREEEIERALQEL